MAAADPTLVFNPFDPAFRIDPYPTYERLREEDPVHQSPLGMVVLSRWEDCWAILRDPRTGTDQRKSDLYQAFVAQQPVTTAPAAAAEEMQPFLFLDPPDHTRLRGLVQQAFTPRRVEQLRPWVQQFVDRIVDTVAERGSMEVIADLAYPLPVAVICELLGVPASDHDVFKGWSQQLAKALDPDFGMAQEAADAQLAAATEFADYFKTLIAGRRQEPRDDLLTALVHAEEEGQKLSEPELIATLILLLVAGHETTVNLIANGVRALLCHRDQWDRLGADPSLVRSAVEEVLRFDPPVQFTGRIAVQDYEHGDVSIPKGSQAIVLLAAANRDPAVFPEPQLFDIARSDNRHLAFSAGIHFCLGAPLARLEGQVALATLATRLPGIELTADELTYKENIILRGLESLPVGW